MEEQNVLSKSKVLSFFVCSPTIDTPENFCVEVAESAQIAELKNQIYAKHPLKPLASAIRLIFRGKLLLDDNLVNSLCNYSECKSAPIIHMVVNPNSCTAPKVITPEPTEQLADAPNPADTEKHPDTIPTIPTVPTTTTQTTSNAIPEHINSNPASNDTTIWPSAPKLPSNPYVLNNNISYQNQFSCPAYPSNPGNSQNLYNLFNSNSSIDPLIYGNQNNYPLNNPNSFPDSFHQYQNPSSPVSANQSPYTTNVVRNYTFLPRDQNGPAQNQNGILNRPITYIRDYLTAFTFATFLTLLWKAFKFGLLYFLFFQTVSYSKLFFLALAVSIVNLVNTNYVRNLINDYYRTPDPAPAPVQPENGNNVLGHEDENENADQNANLHANNNAQNISTFSRIQAFLFAFLISIFPNAPIQQPGVEQ
ncbi:hypothetical protein AYI69_g3133 [Smittium culicis]|uniref:Ubiquitin-like domain-containing protein n=1 Tax=Smittium culicis TaxID=133412 RepID=A0A1R1YKI7_9FUNG|nr:hypothetical protein AYI69_g3133 [Smittium culicis]